MRKYFQIIKATFQEYFIYRLNFFLWRFRSLVFTLSLLFFWLAVYGEKKSLLGYQRGQMLTYILGVVFLDGLILASRTADLAGQIRNGEMSKYLLRPISLFKFSLSRDIGDKVLNLFFASIEIIVIVLLLKFPLSLPSNLISLVIFVFHVIVSFFIYYFFSLVIAFTAFWTEEVWATRWLLGVVLLDFLSGVVFPIDVLPRWLARVAYFTPFPYLIFSPLKIWQGNLSVLEAFKSLAVSFVWLIVFLWLANRLWRRGILKYGAYGG